MAERNPTSTVAGAEAGLRSNGRNNSKTVELTTSVPSYPPKQSPNGRHPAANKPEQKQHRVFVGNLPYNTTTENLGDLFSSFNGVVNVYMATRFKNPMGFGFVVFDAPEEVEKAIDKLNGYDFKGRKILVEHAIDKSGERSERGNIRGAGRGARFGYPERRANWSGDRYRNPESARIDDAQQTRHHEEDDVDSNKPQEVVDTEIRQDEDKYYEQEQENNEDESQQLHSIRSRGRGERRDRGRGRERYRGGVIRRITFEESDYSDVVAFVTNIPYGFSSSELSEVFRSYDVVNSHIARHPDGGSKGYGFVEFASSEEQQKAIVEIKSMMIDRRKIIIKRAIHQRYLRSINKLPEDEAEGEAGDVSQDSVSPKNAEPQYSKA